MHLTIINCSPRITANSNTDKILKKFIEGYEDRGHTTELYSLSQRNTWPAIREAFAQSSRILMAMPLFVECVPGILLEFLETLPPRRTAEGEPLPRLGFLLQGGFAEASQLRCGEQYLEKLPAYFNCEYAGALIKGNMFAVSILEGNARESMIQPFVAMGASFAEQDRFDKEEVSEFAKPEYFSNGMQFLLVLMRPVQKLMFNLVARKRGCRESLKARPYESCLR